jgi:hypothetical protein
LYANDVLHCYTATFGIFNEKFMEMNKEMYLTEHLVLPSEATLSQTSELDGVRKLSTRSNLFRGKDGIRQAITGQTNIIEVAPH